MRLATEILARHAYDKTRIPSEVARTKPLGLAEQAVTPLKSQFLRPLRRALLGAGHEVERCSNAQDHGSRPELTQAARDIVLVGGANPNPQQVCSRLPDARRRGSQLLIRGHPHGRRLRAYDADAGIVPSKLKVQAFVDLLATAVQIVSPSLLEARLA